MENKLKVQSILMDFFDKGILADSTLSFLNIKSNYHTILDEQEIQDNSKLYFDTGIEVLNSSCSTEMKLMFLEKCNYIGNMEDRHVFNLYIFQDYIKKISVLIKENAVVYNKYEGVILRLSKRIDDINGNEVSFVKKQIIQDRTPILSKVTAVVEDNDPELLAKIDKLKDLRMKFGNML